MSKTAKKKFRHPPRETAARDDRYMGIAWMWASMSKDPSTQVGAIIVGPGNKPLGSGYNGPPSRIPDDDINWTRPDKYPYIKHAEKNAIKHAGGEEKTKGATLYVTGPPCPGCMLEIVDAGIAKVIYHFIRSDGSSMLSREDEWEETKSIAKKGGVVLEAYTGNLNWMRDWMFALNHKGAFD